MILITSAEYVQGDLRSEFGEIPPTFLPVGNQPILRYQLAELKARFPGERIVLSLPDDFMPTEYDLEYTNKNRVQTISVPRGLSLSQSIQYAVTMAGYFTESTRILHGDTVITDLPSSLDVVSTASTSDDYGWDPAITDRTSSNVWSGFFSFSNTVALVRALTIATSFVHAIELYRQEIGLEEVAIKGWTDVGHLTNYYRARKTITTQRSFNALEIANGIVHKSGTPREKIEAEAEWFQRLPIEMKPFAPGFYGAEKGSRSSYYIEYLPLTPLNEMFVHGRHSVDFWSGVLSMFDEWFTYAVTYGESSKGLERAKKARIELLATKTEQRLCQISVAGLDIDTPFLLNGEKVPSIRSIAAECLARSLDIPPIVGVMHGDLCFSNTLYDGRNGRLRVIDPRGQLLSEEDSGVVGDVRYDVAKLSHSIVGYYDLIIADRYTMSGSIEEGFEFDINIPAAVQEVSDRYLNFEFYGLYGQTVRDSLSDMILLFLSMVPLHDDAPDRQKAFLLNGARLYRQLKGDALCL